MQPADPMGIPGGHLEESQLPEHLPPQMALAPEQRPYDHPHVIRPEEEDDDGDNEEKRHRRNMASHSLSPEHLGVAGYIKDVAGFVKDAYQTARDRTAAKQRARRASQDASQERQHLSQSSDVSSRPVAPPSSSSSSSPPRSSSPLAEAVTGLFPGLDPHAQACSHADELRHDLMRPHGRRDEVADPAHRRFP
ncbi:hypothetical protein BX666DRAFT_1922424 [Dichotomocladium elegans]|nr:hypothetical protein BX666DRAFT_1922424 [Dichotomocladium elegans]